MAQSVWIRSPRYDLGLVFGGALLTLMVPLVAASSSAVIVPALFWAWVFLFEGTHFWATFSRTYLDRKFFEENRGELVASLGFFVLPALAVLASRMRGDALPMALYGFFIFSWSLYHNTRQHYGFVSIYTRKAGADDSTRQLFRWAIYAATFGPMAHFFLSYKLRGEFPETFGAVPAFLLPLPALIAIGSALFFAWLGVRVLGDRKRGAVDNRIAYLYVLTCAIFYNVMFFVVAPLEPFARGAENFAQQLMILSIMNSLFHNIQYHAIVWHYSVRRYQSEAQGFFGLANRINSRLWSYALAACAFSVVFTWIFWNRGEIPLFGAGLSSGMSSFAYVLYFGIVGHHFYLDQRIWRVGRTKELKDYLQLPGTQAMA